MKAVDVTLGYEAAPKTPQLVDWYLGLQRTLLFWQDRLFSTSHHQLPKSYSYMNSCDIAESTPADRHEATKDF